MVNLFNTSIANISLHKVGNKNKGESIFLSQDEFKIPNDEISAILKEYFFKKFRDAKEDFFGFSHEIDLEYNEMYNLTTEIFENPGNFHEISKKITKHLYDQSNHPHIKSGEIAICNFTDVILDNEKVNAIGIYKSEVKSDFIQIEEGQSNLELNLSQGISLDKIDKGVLIFQIEKEKGYKMLIIDSNRYDSRYWLEHFLGVDIFHDQNYHTKKYIKGIVDFADKVVIPAEDQIAGCQFKNKALDYLAKNDEFEENEFVKTVIDNPDLANEFRNWKHNEGAKYGIDEVTKFAISNHVVNEMRIKFKSTIDLDTNIQIKLNFVNPESAQNFVEKGFDEEKQMYYYLLYFNKEQ